MMKHPFQILSALSLTIGLSTLVGGCGFLTAPEPEPLPQSPVQPKPDLFNAADYNTKGVELNKAGDPKLPEYFEVTSYVEPDILEVRGVEITKTGKAPNEREVKTYGAPTRMRLAGIYTPRTNSVNANERRFAPMAMEPVRKWTLARKLTIEQDPKFPVDLQSIPRVQVFFPGSGPHAGKTLNLNRMMVRSGFAVVDILEPTIFDIKGWLNDEEYARRHRLGLWQHIVLQNRQQPPVKVTTTTTTTTTTSPAPGTPPGDPAAAPGAPAAPAPPPVP